MSGYEDEDHLQEELGRVTVSKEKVRPWVGQNGARIGIGLGPI